MKQSYAMTADPAVPVQVPRADAGGAIDALSRSRERWRDLARMAFDLSFETDAEGRFVLLSPDRAFGWPTQPLLGLPADDLLVQPAGVTGLNPFHSPSPLRRHHAWLRRADGRAASVLVSCSPIRDRDGVLTGVRGAVEDISDREAQDQRLADILLCQQTMREIARRMRRAVLPDTVIGIGLDELLDATGSGGGLIVVCEQAPPQATRPGEGAASLQGAAPGKDAAPSLGPRVLHRAGSPLKVADDILIAHAVAAASGQQAPWTRTETLYGHRLVLSATATRFSDPVVLMLWRDGARDWLDGDPELVAAFLATLGGVLEHDQVQRELARHSGADTLTGLLNRDSFVTEVGRRLDRLDAEGLAATLMVVGLDRFREVNERNGPEAGDDVLRQAAHLLREAVRPTDLVARLGGDVFALWLDGADQFAAAERAEVMCQQGIAVTLGEPEPEPLSMRVSVGLATRPCRSYDSIDGLLEQAHAALGAIKLAGGGRWHFYNEGTGA